MLKNTRLAKLRNRSQPAYIIFEDAVRVRVPESSNPKNPYSIPTPELAGQTVSMETMYELFEKHGQSHDQMEWELRHAYDYAECINEALANELIPDHIRAGLRLDILNLTYFEGPLIRWVLRDFLAKHNIPNSAIPGVDKDGEIDYYISMGDRATKKQIFEYIVLDLAKFYKLMTGSENPEPVLQKQTVIPVDDQARLEALQTAIATFNKQVGLPNGAFDDYPMSVKPIGQSPRSYMTSELRNKYLAEEPANAWELASLFRTDELGRTLTPPMEAPSYALKFSNASIVNMLIYGKTNISLEMVQTLLGLIRFGKDSHCILPAWTQLDNYIIDHTGKYLSDQIKWRDDNLHTLDFAKTDVQRVYVANALIHLMNATKLKDLNMVNYCQIGEWLRINREPVKKLDELIQLDSANRKVWLDQEELD